jgi:hypothetical protein
VQARQACKEKGITEGFIRCCTVLSAAGGASSDSALCFLVLVALHQMANPLFWW